LSSQNHAGGGAGAGSGHYSTVAKNRIDGSWYYFDDSHTAPAEPGHFNPRAAHLLLYHRRKPDEVV
jgi:ubiquitin carboxyl-terminal hydrolase 4/11/15